MTVNKSVNGAVGEHLVLAELLKRGFEAYLANGTTQLGFDIAVILDSGPKYVQVKGLGSSNNSVKVSKSSVHDEKFDYMIIVKFERGGCRSIHLKNEYYVLSLKEVSKILKNKKSTEPNSFTISKGEYQLSNYQNKWCKIT